MSVEKKQIITISIITVCKNCFKKLEKTIRSIDKQTYKSIEHIIVDGLSNDKTDEIITDWGKNHSIKNVKAISERDTGIYNAMNKGIRLATGKYIYFLNAGDTFVEQDVIEKIVNKSLVSTADILVSGMRHKYYGYLRDEFPEKPESAFQNGRGYNHQCIFALKECFCEGFDEHFSIHADLDWECKMFYGKKHFECIDVIVCNYDQYGVSSLGINAYIRQNEWSEIWKKYNDSIILPSVSAIEDMARLQIMDNLAGLLKHKEDTISYFNYKKINRVAIYGYGFIGRFLIRILETYHINAEVMDKSSNNYITNDKVAQPDKIIEDFDMIVVTVLSEYKHIEENLSSRFCCSIIPVEIMINEIYEGIFERDF